MAPPVRVPADFGRKHIGRPAHGNLTLKLKGGHVTKANSMILSLNSCVIDDLTTERHQSTLEMEDFGGPAVDCFIEGCYTGEITVDKATFRELNKMAHAFKVYWLITKCYEYFRHLIHQMTEEDFEEMRYLFEEAEYVLKALKKRNFVNVFIQKISFLEATKEMFVTSYMRDIPARSESQLSLVVEIAGNSVQLLANSLAASLRVEGAHLDDKSRFLLNNIDFTALKQKHNTAYKYNDLLQLLQDMENISNEDLKMILKLHMHNPGFEMHTKLSIRKRIPNVHSFLEQYDELDLEEFVDILIGRQDVVNLYMIIEAVWYWSLKHQSDTIVPDDVFSKITNAMVYRGWCPVEEDVLDSMSGTDGDDRFRSFRLFVSAFKNHKELLSDDNNLNFTINSTEDLGLELLEDHGSKIKFPFRHPATTECDKEGQCGFMLNVAPLNDPDSFSITLCTDPEEYPDDLHFHENLIFAANMRLLVAGQNEVTLYPLSWRGDRCGDKLCGFFKKYLLEEKFIKNFVVIYNLLDNWA